jgi:hypothetical protein
MSVVRATVHEGRLVVNEPTALPEGTEVPLVVVDAGDALHEVERAKLDAAIDEAAASAERGEAVDADEVLRQLSARRASSGTR